MTPYVVTTVKEKHDLLRFYMDLRDRTSSDVAEAMYARIEWAEEESGNRCTVCGAPP